MTSKGVTGESMAVDLLRRFDIGDKQCQDGVIVLYIEADRSLYIRCNPLT